MAVEKKYAIPTKPDLLEVLAGVGTSSVWQAKRRWLGDSIYVNCPGAWFSNSAVREFAEGLLEMVGE